MLAASPLFAVDTTIPVVNGAAVTTNLFHGSAKVSAIYIYNGSSVANVYSLYDAPNTNTLSTLTYSNLGLSRLQAAYTNYTSYLTNYSMPTTNFLGWVSTNVYTNIIMTVPVLQSAAYNTFRLVATGVVGSSNTVSISLPDGIYVAYGVTFTNTFSTNTTVRLVYEPNL